MQKKKRILIDFDGVIMAKGKRNEIQGASKALRLLKKSGYEIVVFSTRKTSESNTEKNFIKDWMKKKNIPCDGITGEKLEADYYIDDKAINFKDWDTTLETVWRKK